MYTTYNSRRCKIFILEGVKLIIVEGVNQSLSYGVKCNLKCNLPLKM